MTKEAYVILRKAVSAALLVEMALACNSGQLDSVFVFILGPLNLQDKIRSKIQDLKTSSSEHGKNA